MGEFRMPSLGADMEAGTLVEWRVAPGATVARGDVVALVETDKGIVEVEIWESGVIESLAVAPGTKAPVGTVLATTRPVGARGVAPPEPRHEAPREAPREAVHEAPHEAPPPPHEAPPPPTDGAPASRALASPSARKLARERGIDLARVRGTGPHGSVTHADVERAGGEVPAQAPSQAPVPPPVAAGPTAAQGLAMRHAIANAMARSKREIPHYYLSADFDASPATRWLEHANATRSPPDRILFAALLLKATALAAREVPEMNGLFVDGAFRPASAVHLGVAIALRQGGLVAPALHDAETLSLEDLQAGLRDLVLRARGGRLRSSEMSDATLTVTNLGDQGVDSVFGVIYPPQVALVGFGKLTERAWASGGMLAARPTVTTTLAADHRVSDGHRGALFVAAIGRLLQEPEKL
jgi:pyruvate dehydrogenase E2 component (dihydrolipoamide acetyltransferase)